jgi:UDP-N-acetylglucosamine--N-acetylmuramyl-(pentapeptide) pyrophosphoryl-undecaprenol N-acetylglucosamine transferase
MFGDSDSSGPPRIVVAGGGTGGHLYPGIAVVEAMQEMRDDLQFTFVGTETGIESRVVPAEGYDLRTMDVPPLKGQGWAGWIGGGLKLTKSGVQAMSLLRELEPALTVSVGGYAAGPFTMAAAATGHSTALMEQNREPGMTNQILGRFVDRAFVAFESTCSAFDQTDCRAVGNPLRRSIRQMADDFTYQPPESGDSFRILVTGGSGGAQSFNTELPRALTELGKAAERVEVRHQYGNGRADEVAGQYDDFPGRVELVEFIDEMAEAYNWCDLLICRGGGTTIAEVLAFGLPALYVPSPHVTDDQQTKNAREIAEQGAGIMLPDQAIGAGRATRLVRGLLDNPVSLENMAREARRLGAHDAAVAIAEGCLELVGADA